MSTFVNPQFFLGSSLPLPLPENPQTSDLRTILQKGPDAHRVLALKQIIHLTLSGSPQTSLLMPIIQYVLPSKDKKLKKLLAFYWEVCPKYEEGTVKKDSEGGEAKGVLRQEMILVCNAIRNDLQHPNEWIRGNTLRLLTKLKEPELLEPLVPTVRSNLEHRHAYVRRHALFALLSIHTYQPQLVPDAAECFETFLAAESDPTSIHHAFVALGNVNPQKALSWLMGVGMDGVLQMDEIVQMGVVEWVRKEAGKGGLGAQDKARFIKLTLSLLSSSSKSVIYDSAQTLLSLTTSSLPVKASTRALINLSLQVSDNNVKLIILEKLEEIERKLSELEGGSAGVEEGVVELLGVLSSPDMEVRRRAISLALSLISSKNIEEVSGVLKKELAKISGSESAGYEKNGEYHLLLIKTLHTLSLQFPSIASSTIFSLMPFLSDPLSSVPSASAPFGNASTTASTEVISFTRSIVQKFPELRKDVVRKLIEGMEGFKSGKVMRGAMWIVGEWCEGKAEVLEAFRAVRKSVGEVPILASEQKHQEEMEKEKQEEESKGANGEPKERTITKVLPDGTYATETVYSVVEVKKERIRPPLRALILGGDYYTASVLASTLTKLVLRLEEEDKDSKLINELRAEAMLLMTSILRVGVSTFSTVPIDEDSQERVLTCLASLSSPIPAEPLKEIYLKGTKEAYGIMAKHVEEKERSDKEKFGEKKKVVMPDDVVSCRLLGKKGAGGIVDETDLTKAVGLSDTNKEDFASKLSKVVQLTGFSDPVYAEAYVKVQQFDILLDVLIVNQTTETLQNLTVEFATLGDLKLLERPVPYTLGPHSFQSIKATVKVSSTETGVIFGNIFYDAGSATDSTGSQSVVLNDIHIDILDYIKPAECTEAVFRSMWTEFEWENRVNVNAGPIDLRAYLQHVMASTNMACLTPEGALSGDCGFLSANLYARSLFGEDALANLSIERTEDAVIGHVRIRSKTQGIALSLGDKITLAQKNIGNLSS